MVWQEMVQMYNHTLFEHADPRVSDWPMMQSPIPTLIICLSYVYIVKYLGPSLMKNREPLDIRWIMAVYNFSMVIFNFLIFYHFGIYGWFGSYSWKCQPVDYSNSPQAIGMANVCWWFFISKFVEFTDTIFFVLRKKFKQISTLHVTHHGILPMSIWWGLRFTPGCVHLYALIAPQLTGSYFVVRLWVGTVITYGWQAANKGGHSTFFAFVNSFVHILMYVYYGLAALGPHMTKYLWWKKYMTTIQMVQFILVFTHSFQLLFRSCNYPQGFMWWIGFHAILFWFLFADFYKNAYRKKLMASSKRENGSRTKENSQSLPLQNGYTNGYVHGVNGYANGHSDSNSISNRCAQKNGVATDIQSHANGYQNQTQFGDSIKKID